jgi:hypothetical protein
VESLKRAIRLAGFDRRVAVGLMFDHGATGDAVLIVAGVHLIVALVTFIRAGFFSVPGLLESLILGVAGWLFLSFAIWIMGTRLLKGTGEAQALIRTSGFAHLPILFSALGPGLFGLLGLAWYLASLVLVTGVVLGLGWKEALGAVVLGAALVYLIQTLFRAPFLLF